MLFIYLWSFTEPGVHQFSKTGWPGNRRGRLDSTSSAARVLGTIDDNDQIFSVWDPNVDPHACAASICHLSHLPSPPDLYSEEITQIWDWRLIEGSQCRLGETDQRLLQNPGDSCEQSSFW